MQKMHLLARAEQRPTQEAQIWFRDGIQLIKAAPFVWAGVSLAGIGINLGALMVGGILAVISPLLFLIPVIGAQIFVQIGMLLLCARLAGHEKIEVGQFFNAFSYLKSRSILQFGIFLLLFNVCWSFLQDMLFPEPLIWIENEQIQMANNAQLYQALIFTISMQVIILFSTWAILPLLVEFPKQAFLKLLRLQFDGMMRNVMPLLLFSLLCMAVISAAFALLLLVGNSANLFIFALFIAIAMILWGWPLLTAWTFSAVRHIFMDW